VCLEPIEGGRVRCRFDRLSGFMIHPGPHRPAHGLTVTLVAFDALAVAGVDLRAQPWHERRNQLERLLGDATGPLRLTPVMDTSAAIHDALVADGWEGTVAKRLSSRYRCGKRTNAWLKIKSPAAIERDRMRVASALRPAA
jgi:bifunctional non-homologous end joining protein LigD